MTDPRALVVAAAHREIGPGNVPKYWASCGIAPPYPDAWCGALALFALHEAGLARDVRWKIARGFCEVQGLARTKAPKPGDIAYTDQPWQHHAIVESLADGILTTIDGNQPDVRRKVRTLPTSGMVFYSIDKFIASGTSDKPTPTPKLPTPPATVHPEPPETVKGIDVSHHQSPNLIRWAELAKTHKFVIARATYGTRPDEYFGDHVKRAQDAGLTVGAYAFYRQIQNADEQLDAFGEVVAKAGMGPGWLAPALDIEQNQSYDGPVTPAGYVECERICREWLVLHGGAIVYTNPSMWAELGSPQWIEDCSLWIAHYGVEAPKTPHGLPWSIWQHKVAPLPNVLNAQLDQNVARSLPILQKWEPAQITPEVDWDELRRDRDRMVRESDDDK